MACWKLRIETKFHFQNSSLLSIYSTGALKWQKSAWDWMKLLCAPEWKCTRGYACQHGISNKCDCWKTGHIHALGWQADQTLVDNLCLDCGSLMRLVTTHHPPPTSHWQQVDQINWQSDYFFSSWGCCQAGSAHCGRRVSNCQSGPWKIDQLECIDREANFINGVCLVRVPEFYQ